jgi:predicted protein tyrosine phosphatase
MESYKRVLFICEANKLRSPTAAALYRHKVGLEVKSAGFSADSPVKLSEELLEWADKIFVMEKRHRNKIRKKFSELYKQKRIICLYIPDEFEYMEPGLVKLLTEKLSRFLGPPGN